jgi:DNA topoisomerase-1
MPQEFKTKSKSAQEAHEAVRPTDPVARRINGRHAHPQQLKLYDLIWRRFLASQMAPAAFDATPSIFLRSNTDSGHRSVLPSTVS